jgi:HD superfamily phosphohydrolase YqeK
MIIEVEEIRALFPELEMVKNKEWVEKACRIWKIVFERSSWKSLTAAQFSDSSPGISLVAHTRAVIQYSLEAVKMIKEFHLYKTEIDLDVLIIAGVLHDVSKLLEYEPGEKGALCQISSIGYTYQHGFYGSYYAEQEGLPSSIVTVITNHTAYSRIMPSTVEGIILFFADQMDAELHKFLNGKSSMILKALGKIGK